MNKFIENDTITKFIDLLREETKIEFSWIQRREIASWSAIIFYFGILWAISEVLLDKSINQYLNKNIFHIILILIPLLLGWIFFRFIH